MGIAVCKKRWKDRDRYKVSRRLFALPDSVEVTDVARSRAGAKMRVGKFVHFSGNASSPCGGKVTRDRQDTCGRQLPCVRSRVSSRVPPVPSWNADNPIHADSFPPPLRSVRFITFAIFRRPKVANAGITRRKPQLWRFERLTAMRAISGRGWLSAGRSERWTRRKNTRDSRDLCSENLSRFLNNKIQILDYFRRLHLYSPVIKTYILWNNNFLMSDTRKKKKINCSSKNLYVVAKFQLHIAKI